jgi:hypothetical protein
VTYGGGPVGSSLLVPFTNNGTVSVSGAGTLSLGAGGTITDTGTFTIASDSTLDLADNATLASAATVSGPGTLSIDGDVTSSAQLSPLPIVVVDGGGTLSFTSAGEPAHLPSVTVAGNLQIPTAIMISSMSLAGGALSGPGTVTVPSGGTLQLGGAAELDNGAHLINRGSASLLATIEVNCYGQVVSLCFSGSSSFENAGSLSIADNAHVVASDNTESMINDAGGTVTYGGGPVGSSLLVPFTNNGTVSVSKGTLSLLTFGPTSSSTLTVGLRANPGKLSVSGSATLKGTLAIATKAGYLPPIGTKVTALKASSRTGSFSTVTGAQLSGEHWVVSYNATSVVLTAVSG